MGLDLFLLILVIRSIKNIRLRYFERCRLAADHRAKHQHRGSKIMCIDRVCGRFDVLTKKKKKSKMKK